MHNYVHYCGYKIFNEIISSCFAKHVFPPEREFYFYTIYFFLILFHYFFSSIHLQLPATISSFSLCLEVNNITSSGQKRHFTTIKYNSMGPVCFLTVSGSISFCSYWIKMIRMVWFWVNWFTWMNMNISSCFGFCVIDLDKRVSETVRCLCHWGWTSWCYWSVNCRWQN